MYIYFFFVASRYCVWYKFGTGKQTNKLTRRLWTGTSELDLCIQRKRPPCMVDRRPGGINVGTSLIYLGSKQLGKCFSHDSTDRDSRNECISNT